jgi:hypothetical protein
MDGKELKEFLKIHAAKHGIKSLTLRERDFLQGRIDYTCYINGCYEEYINDKTVCFPPDILPQEEDIYD